MKQWLLVLLSFITALHTVHAEDAGSNNGASWNVIRERLFNGENSKAFRFEEDVRFQVIGAETHQDSAIFIQLIGELNNLFETVQVKMVDTVPNFKLTVAKKQGGLSTSNIQFNSGFKLVSVKVNLGFPGTYTDKESVKQIYYHTIRQFTKLFTPQSGTTGYGGIFDSSKAADAEFTEIDKEILAQLYSHDFYKNLRNNTVKTRGYSYYLDFRYKKLMNYLSYTFKALLLLFGFLFFLSKESKRKQNPSLFQYIKQRTLILLLFPFFFSIIKTTGMISFMPFVFLTAFVVNYFWTVVCGLLVLVFMYYTEPIFLKRITNFFGKQACIFLSTTIATIVVPTVLVTLFHLIFGSSLLPELNPVSFWSQNSSLLFLITFVAALRVLYNFVHYRIQSMVNQKDVEIAKMKELKNQAELNALHSRINPHFLYNSLNSIASLAHIDADKTENMALGLSELFRYSINKENKTFVTVAEELEMVKKYLEIEKTRFGNKLVYEINADESTREKQIPIFLIQPLVENAVKHGLSKIKDRGKIVVEVKKSKKDLIITIFDNGPDFPAEPVSGYGLQNLHDKLDIIYGNNATINWVNGADKHFKVTLKDMFES